MTSAELDVIRKDGVVPLFGSADPDEVVRVAAIVAEAGLSTLEVTLRAPGALDGLEELCGRVASGAISLTVGAGTVLDAATAAAAIDAGARFVVSPVLSEDVALLCAARGVLHLPGCATPGEIHAALRMGCRAVKLFPAGSIGGPGFLRSVRAVFPGLVAVPTGGVEPDALEPWFDAGAAAVGIGSWMFPPAAVAGRRWDEVGERVRLAVDAVRSAREAVDR